MTCLFNCPCVGSRRQHRNIQNCKSALDVRSSCIQISTYPADISPYLSDFCFCNAWKTLFSEKTKKAGMRALLKKVTRRVSVRAKCALTAPWSRTSPSSSSSPAPPRAAARRSWRPWMARYRAVWPLEVVSVVFYGRGYVVTYRTGSINLGLLHLLALRLRLALLLRLGSKLVGDGLLVLWNACQ